jgi:hypothetical protein
MNGAANAKRWSRTGSRNHVVYSLAIGQTHVGHVTVDLMARGFRFGQDAREGALASGNRIFLGRDWRERLIVAAMTALENRAV